MKQLELTELQLALDQQTDDVASKSLVEAVYSAQQSLDAQLGDFEQGLVCEDPSTQAALAEDAANLRTAFESYQKFLEALEKRLYRWSKSEASSALAVLNDQIQQWAAASLNYRESVWALRGPTSHAGVNELFHHLLRLPDSRGAFEKTLEVEGTKCQANLEFFADATETGDPLRRLFFNFYTTYSDLLNSDRMSTGLSQPEQLERLKTELVVLGSAFSRIDVEGTTKRISHKPTKLDFLNRVINGAFLVDCRATDPLVFQTFLEQAKKRVAERTPKAPAEMAKLAKILDDYELWSKHPDSDFLALLHKRAVETANGLEGYFAGADLPEAPEVSMVCSICGLRNPAAARKCFACGGSVSPQTASMAGLEALAGIDLSNSPRLEKLLLLAVQVVRGQERPVALIAHCDQLDSELEIAIEACSDGSGFSSGGQAASIEAAADDYLDAMNGISEAVKLMRELAENPNPAIVASLGAELSQVNILLNSVKQNLAPLLV